jgi:cell division protein FtsB
MLAFIAFLKILTSAINASSLVNQRDASRWAQEQGARQVSDGGRSRLRRSPGRFPRRSPESCAGPTALRTVHTVRKVLVDMHVAPATRRWGVRLTLALAVAVAIGYVPAQVLARDPRVPGLRQQVESLEAETALVEQHNLRMVREIEALRADVHSIESRARADLGMVYPQEIVLRSARSSFAPATPAASSSPSSPPSSPPQEPPR